MSNPGSIIVRLVWVAEFRLVGNLGGGAFEISEVGGFENIFIACDSQIPGDFPCARIVFGKMVY
jgi:hypothetical protein